MSYHLLKNHLIRSSIKLIEKNKRQNFSKFLTDNIASFEVNFNPLENEYIDSYGYSYFVKQLCIHAKESAHTEPTGLFIRFTLEKIYNNTLIEVNKKQYSQLQINL